MSIENVVCLDSYLELMQAFLDSEKINQKF